MTNSADPDQLPIDLNLHCLQRLGISRFSKTRINSKETQNYKSVFSLCRVLINEIAGMANSVDPDQMSHSATSDLGLHYPSI